MRKNCFYFMKIGEKMCYNDVKFEKKIVLI